jgi:hypothetical protein
MNKFEINLNNDSLTAINKLEGVFAKELTPGMAHTYVESLINKLGGLNQEFGQLVESGKKLHSEIGHDIYGPLVVGYIQWLTHAIESLGHSGNVYFALRDSAPLEAAAKVLWKNTNLHPIGIYANRPILGIEDEIAQDKGDSSSLALSYLKSKGIHEDGQIILSDTGAWGTVIKEIKTKILPNTKLYPFFWYSHNPNIPGYINSLIKISGISDKIGEILNDSMECMFPQQWLRPDKLTQLNGEPDVILTPADYLSVTWGKTALQGISQSAAENIRGISVSDQIYEIEKLAVLSVKAKLTGSWTGVLPENTPTWSHGEEFLASWPIDLLP